MDSLTLSALQAELEEKIIGAKVVKVQQPDKYTVILRLHAATGSNKLLLSAHPVFGRIQLTDSQQENPAAPFMFCMVLRKHLENGRITRISQYDNDRILLLDFDVTDEIGNPCKRRLILEIMGKHSNLILINPETNLILDGIRRYSHHISRHREVLPNREYVFPPKGEKADPDTLSPQAFAELFLPALEAEPQESAEIFAPKPFKLEASLYQAIQGISPFLAREILFRADLDPNGSLDYLGEYEYARLWQALMEVLAQKKNKTYEPVLLKNGSAYYDYYPLKLLSIDPENQETFESMSKAIEHFYQASKDQGSFLNQHKELCKVVAKEEQRLRKKIALQQTDLDSTVHAESFKEAGELLTTYMYLLEKGMTEITVDSFYEDSKQVTIKLLPELLPMDNIKRYFHKFNKAKSAQHLIQEQLDLNLIELEYIESLLLSLDQATTLAELHWLKEELIESGYLKQKLNKKNAGQKPKKVKSEELPPREYTSSDGFTILAGRNNKQNDRLTLKLAAKNDLWLHAQKIPGCHVIIKAVLGKNISDVALLEAAALAAWHSKAQAGNQVPVDYTLVSQVKKPNGAKPGMVNYFQQKTLYVTPKEL